MADSGFKWVRIAFATTGALATTLGPRLVGKNAIKLAIKRLGFRAASGVFSPWIPVAMAGWTVYEARSPVKEGFERGLEWYRQRNGQDRTEDDAEEEDDTSEPTAEVRLISKL